MSQSVYSEAFSASRSRGDMLTEAIISMLLIGLAGMGITYVISDVSVSQREFKVQQQVVNELRSKVQNRVSNDQLCSGAEKTANFDAEIHVIGGCNLASATVTLPGGASVAIDNVHPPVVLGASLDVGDVVVGGSVSGN